MINRLALYSFVQINTPEFNTFNRAQTHLILLPQIHLRHIRQEDRMKRLRHLKIIRRAQRVSTQLVKAELRDVARALWDVQPTAPDLEVPAV